MTQAQAGAEQPAEDVAERVDVPVAGDAGTAAAFVDDGLPGYVGRVGEVVVAQFERSLRLGFEHLQERVGLIDRQLPARLQQAAHRGEEARDVGHPVEHTDGDHKVELTVQLGRQLVGIGFDETRLMRRALGQLPRLGEEGGGLVDPTARATPKAYSKALPGRCCQPTWTAALPARSRLRSYASRSRPGN